MTQAAEQDKLYSVDEYFQIEENTPYRNEYYKGYVYEKPLTTGNQAKVNVNVGVALANIFENTEYETFFSSFRLAVLSKEFYGYVDTMVIRGKPHLLHRPDDDTVTNPVTLVEISNKNTRLYDGVTRFDIFQGLESLEEYLFVDQYNVSVKYYKRLRQNEWKLQIYERLEDIVKLEALKVKLPLERVYHKIEF